MKIILTTLRNVWPHLNFWQFNSIAKFAHWFSLTKVKFHMANLEFFLEVETTRVQIQVLFRAMVDETLDMFPTSITISLGSFTIEFWRGWLLIEFENEVFEDLVGCGGLAKHATFVAINSKYFNYNFDAIYIYILLEQTIYCFKYLYRLFLHKFYSNILQIIYQNKLD